VLRNVAYTIQAPANYAEESVQQDITYLSTVLEELQLFHHTASFDKSKDDTAGNESKYCVFHIQNGQRKYRVIAVRVCHLNQPSDNRTTFHL
jgi:hypothetical protein